jgi:hypothetical protein
MFVYISVPTWAQWASKVKLLTLEKFNNLSGGTIRVKMDHIWPPHSTYAVVPAQVWWADGCRLYMQKLSPCASRSTSYMMQRRPFRLPERKSKNTYGKQIHNRHFLEHRGTRRNRADSKQLLKHKKHTKFVGANQQKLKYRMWLIRECVSE